MRIKKCFLLGFKGTVLYSHIVINAQRIQQKNAFYKHNHLVKIKK